MNGTQRIWYRIPGSGLVEGVDVSETINPRRPLEAKHLANLIAERIFYQWGFDSGENWPLDLEIFDHKPEGPDDQALASFSIEIEAVPSFIVTLNERRGINAKA